MLIDDQEMVAKVQATVAAWKQERAEKAQEEGTAGAEAEPSVFAQPATTEPIPAPVSTTRDGPAAVPVAHAPAPVDAAPAPAPVLEPDVIDLVDVEPAVTDSADPVPAAAAPVATAASTNQYVLCGGDPRPHLGFAASEAIEAVRKKLYDGSLLVEVASEGDWRGEVAVGSEWPDRHPVSGEEVISFEVAALSDIAWRPVAGGRFRIVHGEVVFDVAFKRPWLLVFSLAEGQKFHQALLAPLLNAICTHTGGAPVPARQPEQVDRDWAEMADESED